MDQINKFYAWIIIAYNFMQTWYDVMDVISNKIIKKLITLETN